jgi:hypothetical protein
VRDRTGEQTLFLRGVAEPDVIRTRIHALKT